MRGKLNLAFNACVIVGSIPARAGETTAYRLGLIGIRVYPRPCGGNTLASNVEPLVEGLSPPVRGKRKRPERENPRDGSIPARAGETMARLSSTPKAWVYPRPCGGNVPMTPTLMRSPGLSPPVRGKHHPEFRRLVSAGSIPARAGETLVKHLRQKLRVVYPRPCGGNATGRPSRLASRGLSPPVRGKLGRGTGDGLRPGSIPARAGETASATLAIRYLGVYPRPCGGNAQSKNGKTYKKGLSPPVRGKHVLDLGHVLPSGSIPARAGETGRGCWLPAPGKVYPRPCGGNGMTMMGITRRWGLSPPVRGKQPISTKTSDWKRSIPARAGETLKPYSPSARTRVYPRPCGGNRPARPAAPSG